MPFIFRTLCSSFAPLSISFSLMGPPQAPPRYGRGKVAPSASARGASGRGGGGNRSGGSNSSNTSDDKSKGGDSGGANAAFAAAVAAAQAAAAASYDPLAALLGGGLASASASASRRTLLPPAPSPAPAAATLPLGAAPTLLPPGTPWSARDDGLFVAAAAKYDAFANATNAFIRLIRVRGRERRGRRRGRRKKREQKGGRGNSHSFFLLFSLSPRDHPDFFFLSQPFHLCSQKPLSLFFLLLLNLTNPKGIHGEARQELARLQRAAALGQAHVRGGRGGLRFLFFCFFFCFRGLLFSLGGGDFGGGVGGCGRSPPAAAPAAPRALLLLLGPDD